MSRSVYRVPPGVAFADVLARGLLTRTAGDPLALADMLVLLPTRRACRTLHQSFLRESGGRALLLPRLMPLGDLDADELTLTAGLSLPPAVSPRRRQLLLARLIARHHPDLPTAQLLNLARSLGRLLDDFILENINPAAIDDLVPADFSQHWQETIDFLRPVLTGWPHVLAAEGALDPADRRSRLLRAQAQAWLEQPPATPVIAAGSTGSIPATAELLRIVSGLPQGEVILPGLPGADACAEWWPSLDATHPLFELKNLLARLETALEDVRLWPAATSSRQTPREALLHKVLLPASKTEAWVRTAEPPVTGLTRIDCAHEQEEATVIALAMREALETPGLTAMLVTPDRNLGRRVASVLQHWSIGIDDSAGTPLHKTESATFLRAILDHACSADMVSFLSMMKHPMAAAGLDMAGCRRRIHHLERKHLRHRTPVRSLHALKEAAPEDREWLEGIAAILAPVSQLLEQASVSLGQALATLAGAAEKLATTDLLDGAQRLWRGEAGQALATWASELQEAAGDFPPLRTEDLAATLLTLMSDQVVRPRYGEHPRLFILGPLEARLQQADLVILGGLNEGTWPAPPDPDPWLSRAMRTRLGLKTPEERIGQEAHDFYTLAASTRVLLTRAVRQSGTPTVPARWLSRLAAVQPKTGPDHAGCLALARIMDTPAATTPALPPSPRPPLHARPKRLSVTQIEQWVVDPYAIYARKILNLKQLEPLEPDPGAAERGSFYHAVFKRFVAEHRDSLSDSALDRLLELGADELERQGLARQRTLWWPRFVRMADWFVKSERARRTWAQPLALEVNGEMIRPGGFTVTARADRIDSLHAGGLAIIDYKTGSLPKKKERENGYSLQLPLEAAIAISGGFEGITAQPVGEMTFWHLSGAREPGLAEPFMTGVPIEETVRLALDRLDHLVAEFSREDTPYLSEPRGGGSVRYSDYRHLARIKEWAFAPEDGE